MLRTQIVRGISPYALWLTKSKGQHAGVQERAKLVAAAYHAQSPSEMAALVAEAKAMPTPERKEKKDKKVKKVKDENWVKKPPTAYNVFIKANYESVKNLPKVDRFKALATKWAARKKSVRTANSV
jgi:hypothetical protein